MRLRDLRFAEIFFHRGAAGVAGGLRRGFAGASSPRRSYNPTALIRLGWLPKQLILPVLGLPRGAQTSLKPQNTQTHANEIKAYVARSKDIFNDASLSA
jgi:hypothetical protein